MRFIALALAVSAPLVSHDPLAPVPGATNPAITQANIQTTICVHGFTARHGYRPSTTYTNHLKQQQMAALGLTGPLNQYEEDHLISLEIGGNPTDPNNLWPQRWHGQWNAHDKDRLENALHRLVCSGAMTLAQAQHEISTDWVASYQAHIH